VINCRSSQKSCLKNQACCLSGRGFGPRSRLRRPARATPKGAKPDRTFGLAFPLASPPIAAREPASLSPSHARSQSSQRFEPILSRPNRREKRSSPSSLHAQDGRSVPGRRFLPPPRGGIHHIPPRPRHPPPRGPRLPSQTLHAVIRPGLSRIPAGATARRRPRRPRRLRGPVRVRQRRVRRRTHEPRVLPSTARRRMGRAKHQLSNRDR